MTRRTDILQIRLEQTGDGKVKASLAGVGEGLDTVDNKVQKIGKHSEESEFKVSSLGKAIAAIGAGAAIGAVVAINDEYTRMEGQLRLVTKGQDQLRQVQDELYKSSQNTRTEYASTVELYARVARNAGELHLSQQQLLDITTLTNQAIQISGASAEEASGGVIQFSQAMASGVLRGDEFNSVMENMPRLAKAIADGLHIPLGALRAMSQQGKLTADLVTKALLSQSDVINSEFAQLPVTVDSAMTQVKNAIGNAISEANTGDLTNDIQEFVDILEDPGTKEAIKGFGTFIVTGLTAAVKLLDSLAWGAGRVGEEIAKYTTGTDLNILNMNEDQLVKKGAEIEQKIALLRQQGLQGQDRAKLAMLTGGSGPAFDAAIAAGTANEIKKLQEELKLVTGAYQTLQHLNPGKVVADAGDSAKGAADSTLTLKSAAESYIDKLQAQLDLLGKTPGEIAAMVAASKGATTEQQQQAAAIADSIEKRKEELKLMDDKEKASKKEAEQLKNNVEALRESLLTDVEKEQERYQKSLDMLKSAEEQKLSTTMSYADLRKRVEEDHQKALSDIEKQATEEHNRQLASMNEFAIQAAHNMQDAFSNYFFDAMNGKFDNMASDFGKTLERMAAELAASKLLDFLTGDLGSTGELGGFLGTAVSFVGSLFGGTTTAAVGHDGGIGSEITSSRIVPSATFTNVPRLHQGYDPSTEMPAIIRKDEGVFTPEQMKAMGGNVYHIAIDARGADAGVEQRLEAKFRQMAEQEILPKAVAASTDHTINSIDRMGRRFA